MPGMLGAWILSLILDIAGLASIAAVYFLKLTGLPVLLGPLLIATGVSVGGVANGLRNPAWVIVIFVGIIGGFVVLHFVNPYGLGSVI